MGSGRIASVVVAAACGHLDFDPYHFGATGDRCTSELDCGLCEPCVAGVCGTAAHPSQLYLGHRSTCFLDADGARWCTGEGIGPWTQDGYPGRLASDAGWTSLYLGWGTSYGWRAGELDAFYATAATVSPASNDPTWNDVSITESNVCFHHTAADATCNLKAIPGTWAQISAGDDGICGVQTDGSLWCWGTEHSNDLGQGVEPDQTVIAAPARVGTANDWLEADNGNEISCALKQDHTLWCWGGPAEAGANGVDPMGVPLQISPDTDWTWLHVRWGHGCAGKADGRVFCWGADGYGLKIVPGASQVPVPTEIAGYRFDQFLLGGHHYCATLQGGSDWYCWGWNGRGQLVAGTADVGHDAPTIPVCTR